MTEFPESFETFFFNFFFTGFLRVFFSLGRMIPVVEGRVGFTRMSPTRERMMGTVPLIWPNNSMGSDMIRPKITTVADVTARPTATTPGENNRGKSMGYGTRAVVFITHPPLMRTMSVWSQRFGEEKGMTSR